jgi:hypothetical protein
MHFFEEKLKELANYNIQTEQHINFSKQFLSNQQQQRT